MNIICKLKFKYEIDGGVGDECTAERGWKWIEEDGEEVEDGNLTTIKYFLIFIYILLIRIFFSEILQGVFKLMEIVVGWR